MRITHNYVHVIKRGYRMRGRAGTEEKAEGKIWFSSEPSSGSDVRSDESMLELSM